MRMEQENYLTSLSRIMVDLQDIKHPKRKCKFQNDVLSIVLKIF